MSRRVVWVSLARALVGTGTLVLLGFAGVRAENTQVCRWPSFAREAQVGDAVVVAEVVETMPRHPIDGIPRRLRIHVSEVVAGTAPKDFVLRVFGPQGYPVADSCAPTIIDVEQGDELALVLSGRPGAVAGPVSAAAFLNRDPESSPPGLPEPGLRRLTLDQVRTMAALPATDVTGLSPFGQAPAPSVGLVVLAAAAVAGAVVGWQGSAHRVD